MKEKAERDGEGRRKMGKKTEGGKERRVEGRENIIYFELAIMTSARKKMKNGSFSVK